MTDLQLNSNQLRVSIIGLGLLGASLGMALRGKNILRTGWARREEIRKAAINYDVVDEVFGFAGAFEAKDKFDHSNVSLCSNVLSLRERSLTENQSSFASIAAFISSYPGFPRSANIFFL